MAFASDFSINQNSWNHSPVLLHVILDLRHNDYIFTGACFLVWNIRKHVMCFEMRIPFTHLTFLQDFAHYKAGVYKHITGYALGGHAVKLIGWGTTDDGEDYWVC